MTADRRSIALRSARRLATGLFLLPAVGLAWPAGQGMTVKLNRPLARREAGSVTGSVLSQDGAWAVYRADQEVDERFELYGVPTDGSDAPVRISGPLASALADVATDFAISADGERVVYRSSEASAVLELYSAPIDGSAASVRLDAALPVGREVSDFRISPDGARVVYRADPASAGLVELFSVPIDASASPVKLNATLAAGADVYSNYAISPDSTRVVYRAGSQSTRADLFSVPIDASTSPLELSALPTAQRWVETFAIAPNDARVVYQANQDQFGVQELFSVPIDASASPVQLNAPFVAGGELRINDLTQPFAFGDAYRISPTSDRVVYRADGDVAGRVELYSAPIAGGAVAKLNPPITDGQVRLGFDVSADGNRAVFRVNPSGSGPIELYSTPTSGGTPLRLHGALPANSTGVTDFALDRAGNRVAFRADLALQDEFEIFSAPVGGGSVLALSGSLAGAVTGDLQVTPAGGRVLYSLQRGGSTDLASVPIDATAPPVEVMEPAPAYARDLTAAQLTADGQRVVYCADERTNDVLEVFVAPLDAGSQPVRLSAPLVTGPVDGAVLDARVLPGGGVLYIADEDTWKLPELFFVGVGGTNVRAKLAPTQPLRQVTSFLVDPAATRVVYVESDFFNGDSGEVVRRRWLSSRTLPGGDVEPLVALAVGREISFYEISPDGSRVVYVADQDENDVFELYSVPSDGSAPSAKLNAALASGGDVTAGSNARSPFRIRADSSLVLYRADQEADQEFELFRVPLDGSAAPTRVNAPLVGGGDVANDFELSLDGTRALYVADQDTDNVQELFSAPLVGAAAPIRVSGPMVAGGDVQPVNFGSAFCLSPDGVRVTYVADQDADGQFEIFSAFVAIAGTPIQLNPPLDPSGDVDPDVAIDPLGSRVLFEAQDRLFSARTDGGVPVVQIAGPGLGWFKLTADGNHVLYRISSALYVAPIGGGSAPVLLANSAVGIDDVRTSVDGARVYYSSTDLFVRPADASAPAERLGHVLAGGFVSHFDVDPAERFAVFIGPRDTPGVDELYLHTFERMTRRAGPPKPIVH